jgi:cytochrome c5
MKNITKLLLVLILGLSVVACYDSSSDNEPRVVTVDGGGGGGGIGSATEGKTYYTNTCSDCHAAGADDTSTALGATDLAQKHDMITNDMSAYDATYNMMFTFSNLSQKRVDDLKAYLATL